MVALSICKIIAYREHTAHIRDFTRIQTRQIDAFQILTAIEHIPRGRDPRYADHCGFDKRISRPRRITSTDIVSGALHGELIVFVDFPCDVIDFTFLKDIRRTR